MKRMFLTCAILLCGAAAGAQPCSGALDGDWIRENYTKREVMIPMRDSVMLSTTIYEPTAEFASTVEGRSEGGCPIMMTRTPYGLKPYGAEEYARDLGTTYKNYVANAYIIVYQSVRGTYLSEGEFVNIRPVGAGDADDATDTFDTIEWLLANTSSNGCVGVKGVSYPGFYSTVAGLCGHPALKAVSPQAPVTDWFLGDDFHHNGALYLCDIYTFTGFLSPRRAPSADGGKHRPEGTRIDTCVYEYFRGRSISDIMVPLGDSIVFWNDVKAHPDYDGFWKAADPTRHFNGSMPAMMVVGGLYDAEDFYGPYRTYRQMLGVRKDDTYLVEGPWYHGAWRDMAYNHMDAAWFGDNSTPYYLDNIEYPFFAYYLEGKGEKPAPVWVMPSGESAPEIMDGRDCAGMWETLESWPAADAKGLRLSLNAADSTVSAGRHVLGSGRRVARVRGRRSRSYVSDPSDPVPYYHEAMRQKKRDRDYMCGDQRWIADRSDVLTYSADPQRDTLRFLGPVRVHLRVRQSSADADYIVKIVDERPDGYQMLVRADVMPARYHRGFAKSHYIKVRRRSGLSKAFTLEFTMPDIAHDLLPGHRLLVQVQSSWFPLVAMNPQTRCNYYEAAEEDYSPATIAVTDGSWISIPVR